jgi:hypothetical protein
MTAFVSNLRRRLAVLGVSDASSYRSHDFRRGHAKDSQVSGASLFEILSAGGWSSPAFLKYIDACELEREVALQSHLDELSDEEG